MTTESRAIAMLIDGDNAQAPLIERVLAEAAKYGQVTTRRIFGDWSTSNMKSWKDVLNLHALQPVQQFNSIKGKNSTDIALIIDAMDLLHGGTVQGFCIVSSDSDFTRLATRIRQQGFFVMGIGQQQTPEAFTKACDTFVFTEDLAPQPKKATAKKQRATKDWKPIVTSAIESSKKVDGWARLADVGTYLKRQAPDFSYSALGHRQLSGLIKSDPKIFELRGEGTQTTVRLKK